MDSKVSAGREFALQLCNLTAAIRAAVALKDPNTARVYAAISRGESVTAMLRAVRS